MVTVTKAAITKIKEEMAYYNQEKVEELFLRLGMGVGWGGPQLRLALEESALPTDEQFEQDGIKFLVNNNDKPYFNGLSLDYRDSWMGGGFTLVDAGGGEVGGKC